MKSTALLDALPLKLTPNTSPSASKLRGSSMSVVGPASFTAASTAVRSCCTRGKGASSTRQSLRLPTSKSLILRSSTGSLSIDKVMLGPFAHRGQLDLTVALFSVKSADLAAPYLELLTSLADSA